MDKQEIMSAFLYRHACKLFDENKKIPTEDFEFLLEIFRQSPSSFGMEPWRVIVVRDRTIRERLREACWNQPQITTCAELVVFTVDIASIKPLGSYVHDMFARRNMPAEMQEAYNLKYADYHTKLVDSAKLSLKQKPQPDIDLTNRELYHWSAKQCYIAAANMMSVAAMIGIDSCPIEGFEKEKVEQILGLDTPSRQIALIVPFGYRVKEQPVKFRLNPNQITEYK